MVLLDGKNLDTCHKGFSKANKLTPILIGPYSIVGNVHKDSYGITMSKHIRIHFVFRASLLKLYEQDVHRKQQKDRILLAKGTT